MTSVIDRLRLLPQLFRGSDLTIRFGWTSKNTSQYLYLWKRRGLVEGLGGKSDVFANMLKCASPDWEAALLMAMPSAVLNGHDVLRRVGWITQIPAQPAAVVDARQAVFISDHFDVQARSADWYKKTANAINKPELGLPSLKPEWALAELLKNGWDGCGLHPDDLYLDDMDWNEWMEASQAFGVPEDAAEALAVESR